MTSARVSPQFGHIFYGDRLSQPDLRGKLFIYKG